MNIKSGWINGKFLPSPEPIYSPEEIRQRIERAVSACDLHKLDSECRVTRKTITSTRNLLTGCSHAGS